jgi:hypothetical protein
VVAVERIAVKNMSGQFRCMLALSLVFCASGCGSAPFVARIYDASAFGAARSLEIRDFSAHAPSFLDVPSDGDVLKYKGSVEILGHTMATMLLKEIQKRVPDLPACLSKNDSATADLYIEGRFTELDDGDEAAVRMLGFSSKPVVIGIRALIRMPAGDLVAEFIENQSSKGGLFARGCDEVMKGMMAEIAGDAAQFITRNISQGVLPSGEPAVMEDHMNPSSVFFEAGGNCITFSANYDMVLSRSYGFRIGLSPWLVSSAEETGPGVSLAVMGNYFLGSRDHKFELGVGIYLASREFVDYSPFDGDNEGSKIRIPRVAGTGTVGYRYQPYDGGMMLRIGITPFFSSAGIAPWVGCSVGYVF